MSLSAAVVRQWEPHWPIDLVSIWRPLQQGAKDPTLLLASSGESQVAWRTLHTEQGPAVVRVTRQGSAVAIAAWGPGADVAAEQMPRHLGGDDDPRGFDVVALTNSVWSTRVHARAPQVLRGWRVPCADNVADVLVGAILGQRVTGIEAHRAWRTLIWLAGHPARQYCHSAPAALMVSPSIAQWRAVPVWSWRRAGVDSARSDTILRCLAALAGLPLWSTQPDVIRSRLRRVSGYGVWTDALLASRSFGDADAVPFRDFHACHSVCHAFTGQVRGSDAQMETLLAPWSGHRFRVVRAIEMCGVSAPRRGPRLASSDHRHR